MYEFDSVKMKYIKEDTEMYEMEDEEDREMESTKSVFKRYEKQI